MTDWASSDAKPDVLGDGYEAVTLMLPDDDEGPVVATVVRRLAGAEAASRAVLFVHGYNDYFFQAHLAQYFVDLGIDFYALDLRKSGRSIRAGQTPYFMRDVAEYTPELDAALSLIVGDGHTSVLINAHSTGGLITAMWLDAAMKVRSPAHQVIDGMILNSPFLSLDPDGAARSAGAELMGALGSVRPYALVPNGVSDLYVRSIYKDYQGEWDFDLGWKPMQSTPVRAGWLAGIRRAQRALHAGLGIECPILVLCSDRSIRSKEWTDELLSADAVLDVDQIARWSTALGAHVTCVRISGGMHDLVLSDKPVREQVLSEMSRWIGAYLR
jgi:alpha-beta hydrolase superfamily lysophospholipase